jgi:hypothetical protein
MKLIISLELQVPESFAADAEQKHGFEEEIRQKNFVLFFTEWLDYIKVKDVIDYELIGRYSFAQQDKLDFDVEEKYLEALKNQYRSLKQHINKQQDAE